MMPLCACTARYNYTLMCECVCVCVCVCVKGKHKVQGSYHTCKLILQVTLPWFFKTKYLIAIYSVTIGVYVLPYPLGSFCYI